MSSEGLLFHLDEGQKKVKEVAGLRDQKTGSEWTLGQTGMGAMAVGAVAMVSAAGVVGAVMAS